MVAAAALEELVETADVVAAFPEPVAVGALVLLEEELLDEAAAMNLLGSR